MTSEIIVQWVPHGPSPNPLLPSVDAVYVEVDVILADRSVSTRFLIDTGADFTTLGPADSFALFGPDYFRSDFVDRYPQIPMRGVGGDSASATIHEALLTFFAKNGGIIEKRIALGSVRPGPTQLHDYGNSSIPNLLGRDILQHFDLHLSYHPPSVTLTEASTSS